MKNQNIFSPVASETFSQRKTLLVVPKDVFFHVLHPKLLMLEICLLFETFYLNHLSTNPVHLQGKTCRVENERKIKSRPSGFFLSFKLLYKCTWPSKYFSTNAWHWCLLQCIVIGWMVNGRFLLDVGKKNDKVVIG